MRSSSSGVHGASPRVLAGGAQGGNRDYAFHTLGWLQFQRLAESVLVDQFGQTVQRFEPGRDGGRDAAFYGSWTARGESYSGSFMFQVKFTSVRGGRLVGSLLGDEIAGCVATTFSSRTSP